MAREYSPRSTTKYYIPGSVPEHNDLNQETKEYWNIHLHAWQKKKSRKPFLSESDITYFEFTGFPVSSIWIHFKPTMVEKVGLFLSMVYTRSLLAIKEYNYFAYWSANELKKVLGDNYREIIDQLLQVEIIGIDKSTSRYNAKLPVIFLKPSQKLVIPGDRILTRRHITDRTYFQRLEKFFEAPPGNTHREPFYEHIEASLKASSLHIVNVKDVLKEIADDKFNQKEAELKNPFIAPRRKNNITKQISDEQIFVEDRMLWLQRQYDLVLHARDFAKLGMYRVKYQTFGYRLMHMYSTVPKKIRKYIKLEGEDTVELDIKTSQVVFLYVALAKFQKTPVPDNWSDIIFPSEFMKKFEEIYTSDDPDMYNYLAKVLHQESGYQFIRAHMKTFFYRLCFGNPGYDITEFSRQELITKAFGAQFYKFLTQMFTTELEWSHKSLGEKREKRKNLAFMLQATEASYMRKIFIKLADKKIPYIPVYDCLIIKKSDKERVLEIIQKKESEKSSSRFVRFE